MEIKIAEMIKTLRKERNLSQEELAQMLGITMQAVSKWENQVSCPDISMLPLLAEILGVTIDYLLTGREPEGKNCFELETLPDDDVLRILQVRGRTVLSRKKYDPSVKIPLIMPERSKQPALNVEIWGDCSVEGDIAGNIECGQGVCCGNVGGYVDCGSGVNCGNVGGYIDCGSGVNCGNVGGYIDCGSGVNCGNVGGYIDCGQDVSCGNITGDVTAGGKIECNDINGNIQRCEGSVYCETVKGDINCRGNIIYHK